MRKKVLYVAEQGVKSCGKIGLDILDMTIFFLVLWSIPNLN